MKKRVFSILLALGLLAGSLLSACNGGAPSTSGDSDAKTANAGDLPVLRVAVIPFLNSVPVKYMQNQKLDEANGFKIETVYFPSGGPMNEALAGEQWDVGTLSAASVFSLANYNAHVVADVQHSEGGIYTLAAADSDILKVKGANPDFKDIYGDPATLKGKTIAVPTGTISELNVNEWLAAIGVNPEDVQLTGMEFAQAYQALIAGKIDVAALNPPTSFEAEAKGFKVTSSLKTLGIPQYDSIVVADKAYKDKKDLVVKYIKAFYMATDALQSDTETTAQLLLDWYTENGSQSTLEACRSELKNRPFVTSNEAKTIQIGESVKVTAKFFAEKGKIESDKLSVVETNVDTDLIKEALK